MRRIGLGIAVSSLLLGGCGSVPPPPSQFPTPADAIAQMKATFRCERAVHGEAAVDRFSDKGRIRGRVLIFAAKPSSLRFDLLSPPPFNAVVTTLTASSDEFRLYDLRERAFLLGPSSPCNVARLTEVPIEPQALVKLLGGEAPLLVHRPEGLRLAWNRGGYYELEIASTRDAVERIHLAPSPADFGKPWSEQRVRVLDVRVLQRGRDLYHAELTDHAWAPMGRPLTDPEGIDAPIAPSGPACAVEVPRRIHIEVPAGNQDVLFRYDQIEVNPPLPPGVFTQPVPPGVSVRHVTCR